MVRKAAGRERTLEPGSGPVPKCRWERLLLARTALRTLRTSHLALQKERPKQMRKIRSLLTLRGLPRKLDYAFKPPSLISASGRIVSEPLRLTAPKWLRARDLEGWIAVLLWPKKLPKPGRPQPRSLLWRAIEHPGTQSIEVGDTTCSTKAVADSRANPFWL